MIKFNKYCMLPVLLLMPKVAVSREWNPNNNPLTTILAAGVVQSNSNGDLYSSTTIDLPVSIANINATTVTSTNANVTNLSVTGPAHVGGAFSASGSAVIDGTLTANGAVNLEGPLSVTGPAHVGGAFSASGSAVIDGTAHVGGAFSASGPAVIDGTAHVGGAFSASGSAVIDGTAHVGGAFSASGSATFDGTVTANSTKEFYGTTNFKSGSTTNFDIGSEITGRSDWKNGSSARFLQNTDVEIYGRAKTLYNSDFRIEGALNLSSDSLFGGDTTAAIDVTRWPMLGLRGTASTLLLTLTNSVVGSFFYLYNYTSSKISVGVTISGATDLGLQTIASRQGAIFVLAELPNNWIRI